MKKISIIPKFSIHSIISIALSLSLILIARSINLFIPRLNGYSLWEIYFTVAICLSFVLNFSSLAIVLLLAPFLFFAVGQVSFLNPWTFLLDYSLPIFFIIFTKLSKTKKTIVFSVFLVGFLKLTCHTIVGKLYWIPDSHWYESFIINLPFIFSTTFISAIISFIVFDRLQNIKLTQKMLFENKWTY